VSVRAFHQLAAAEESQGVAVLGLTFLLKVRVSRFALVTGGMKLTQRDGAL